MTADHHALTAEQWAAIGRDVAALRRRDGLPPYRGRRDLRVDDLLLAELLVEGVLAGGTLRETVGDDDGC